MPRKLSGKSRTGLHRPWPDWQYRVEWPNDEGDLTKRVSQEAKKAIAERLFGYLLFPPPVRRGPGGRSALAKTMKGASAADIKQVQFESKQQEAFEKLQDYVALQQAFQLSKLEQDEYGTYRHFDRPEYQDAFHQFRLTKGFSRILRLASTIHRDIDPSDSSWKVDRAAISDMVAVYFTYDLLERMNEAAKKVKKPLQSEGVAQHVILLRQHDLGITLNYSEFDKTCIAYRSVAHLLVAVMRALQAALGVDERNLDAELGKRSVAQWSSLIAKSLPQTLALSERLRAQFGAMRIPRRATPPFQVDTQLQLPENLELPQRGPSSRGLTSEEQKLLDAIATVRKREARKPLSEKSLFLNPHKITSSVSKSYLSDLMRSAADHEVSADYSNSKRK